MGPDKADLLSAFDHYGENDEYSIEGTASVLRLEEWDQITQGALK